MTNQWGRAELGTLPPPDTAPFYTTTSVEQWRLEGNIPQPERSLFIDGRNFNKKRTCFKNNNKKHVTLCGPCQPRYISGLLVTPTNPTLLLQIIYSSHVIICLVSRGGTGFPLILPSTQEGNALVVPATCPGKQEHLTVWERSSILFLLQQRWAATTSQVPVLSCDDPEDENLEETTTIFRPRVVGKGQLRDFSYYSLQNYTQVVMISCFFVCFLNVQLINTVVF